jgi:hypothetical protein
MLRFRPILTTTMATLLGALPLALGSGAGRRPKTRRHRGDPIPVAASPQLCAVGSSGAEVSYG